MNGRVDVNAALRSAALAGDKEGVLQALAVGAVLDAIDEHGWTPLIWAAGAGKLSVVDLLLKKGADPFVEGNDRRTSYLVAVAAGHAETAERLARAEAERGGDTECKSSRLHETRHYCRAYRASELRAFKGWRENPIVRPDPCPAHIDQELLAPIEDNDVLYLHRTLSVTRSLFQDELVIFDGDAPGWAEFCTEILGFKPLVDSDWIVMASKS